jgi:4-aminobutyrate aminotransferase
VKAQFNAMTTTNEALQIRKDAATSNAVGVMTKIYVDRAKNAELWDVEGRRYIDFAAGIAVLNTGHCHPKVIAAVRTQLERFTHTAYQVLPYESYVSLAEKLNVLTPGDFPKKTALFNTGAEAVENAVKIARAYTGRPGVIALSGAFHGRTYLAMSLTGKVVPYKAGFGPFPGSIYHIPAPIALHGGSVEASLRALESLFKVDIDHAQVAAIMLEPVQGEGGFYVAPPELMRGLKQACEKYGIVLIADEVQSGFARTGEMFAMCHYDVEPDLVVMAKSLAGGLPLSAVTGRQEIMDAPAVGGLGGTYAGNPLAVAAAHAVLEVIDEEKLCARARLLGERLNETLATARAGQARIAEIRGPGSMVAVEFMKPGTISPDAEFTKAVQTRALERGLVLLTCGIHGNVIRFLYPLTIEDHVFEEALEILRVSLQD